MYGLSPDLETLSNDSIGAISTAPLNKSCNANALVACFHWTHCEKTILRIRLQPVGHLRKACIFRKFTALVSGYLAHMQGISFLRAR